MERIQSISPMAMKQRRIDTVSGSRARIDEMVVEWCLACVAAVPNLPKSPFVFLVRSMFPCCRVHPAGSRPAPPSPSSPAASAPDRRCTGRVGQLGNVLRVIVLGPIRINVKRNCHVGRLARLEALLGWKQEALHLDEVQARQLGRHMEHSRSMIGLSRCSSRGRGRTLFSPIFTSSLRCSGSNFHGRSGETLASKRMVAVR